MGHFLMFLIFSLNNYFLGNTFFAKRVTAGPDFAKKYNVPAGIYLFKINNRNSRARCRIYSKLTIKTPERRH